MKKTILLSLLVIVWFSINAQDSLKTENIFRNTADKLLASDGAILIGGYGEVHYNQSFNSNTRSNGTLDVHRMVMLLGYNFNSRTQFISEIEYEHVSEVYIEQAFLQYKFNRFLNFRAGLILVPMGIVNEYHEPTAFNGVERPMVDNKISPTTWREVGLGLSGNVIEASLKYQAYLVNGFNGYNGKGNLSGKNGFRNGRQKGAESYISSPNLTAKVEYYGIRNLNIGIAGYFGKTQSTLYNGLDKADDDAKSKADSSVTSVSMVGLDARYNLNGLQIKGQFYYVGISNTMQYNQFTTQGGIQNDLGSAMLGYYVEAGYNILKYYAGSKSELIPFIRLESYNTHYAKEGALQKNKAYDNNVISSGLSLKLAKGAVLKVDIQFAKSKAADEYSKTLNAGIGVMF